MSILSPVPRAELGTRFTHYGWFCCLVPVYIAELESEAPLIVERNGVPAWVLGLAERLFGAIVWISARLAVNPVDEYALLITGPIASEEGHF